MLGDLEGEGKIAGTVDQHGRWRLLALAPAAAAKGVAGKDSGQLGQGAGPVWEDLMPHYHRIPRQK
jgi:hypothetical protein